MNSKKQTKGATPSPDQAVALHVDFAEKTMGQVSEVVVNDTSSSMFAQGMRSGLNQKIKSLSEERMSITRDMDAAKKKIMDLYRQPLDALTLCVRDLDRKILAFDEQQRLIAREAQRKLDAEAEKQRQRDLVLAEKAAQRGDMDKAAQFEDRAMTRVAPIVQSESVVAAGVSFRTTWAFEIIDPKKVLLTIPDEVSIGKAVRALGPDAQATVGAGVRIFEKRGIAS